MIANTALDIRTKEAPAYMRWGKTMAERDLALQLAKEAAIANTPGAQVFAESCLRAARMMDDLAMMETMY